MLAIDRIKGFFAGKRRIDRISVEQLKRERIRVEQMEARAARDVEQLESRKEELFLRGKDEPSARQRLAAARKIKDLDAQARAKGRQMAFFNKHLRIINGLLQIKENMALLSRLRLGSIISRMSVAELTEYVDKACVEGQFEMEKFASLLGSLEAAVGADEPAGADPDVEAIVAAMEQARAAEDAGAEPAVARAVQQMNETLEKHHEPAVEA